MPLPDLAHKTSVLSFIFPLLYVIPKESCNSLIEDDRDSFGLIPWIIAWSQVPPHWALSGWEVKFYCNKPPKFMDLSIFVADIHYWTPWASKTSNYPKKSTNSLVAENRFEFRVTLFQSHHPYLLPIGFWEVSWKRYTANKQDLKRQKEDNSEKSQRKEDIRNS